MSKEQLATNYPHIDYEFGDAEQLPAFERLSQLEYECEAAYQDELWASIKLDIDADQLDRSHHFLNAPRVWLDHSLQHNHEKRANREYGKLMRIRDAKLALISGNSETAKNYFLRRLAGYSDLVSHEDAAVLAGQESDLRMDLGAYSALGGDIDAIQELYDAFGIIDQQ